MNKRTLLFIFRPLWFQKIVDVLPMAQNIKHVRWILDEVILHNRTFQQHHIVQNLEILRVTLKVLGQRFQGF